MELSYTVINRLVELGRTIDEQWLLSVVLTEFNRNSDSENLLARYGSYTSDVIARLNNSEK